MNIKEMHISIEQSLQQVSAYRTRAFQDEEIDLYINKISNRLVQQKLVPKPDASGGYNVNSMDEDFIRPLKVTGAELKAYADGTKNRYKAILPADYDYLLDDSSFTVNLCGRAKTEVTNNLYLTIIKQKQSEKSSAQYYETLTLTTPDSTTSIPSGLPQRNAYLGYRNKIDIQFLIPWVRNTSGTYWESFGDIRYDNSYIHVNPLAPAGTFGLAIDGNTLSDTTTSRTLTYKTHTVAGTAAVLATNRLLAGSIALKMQSHDIYKSAHFSPISELSGNILYVYYDSSFIVSKVVINYIRKLLPVSLSLGIDSELPPAFHDKLCDLTVEAIKFDLQNQIGAALKGKEIADRVIL